MTDEARPDRWDPALLHRIANVEEVVIETARHSGDPRRTVIWIVADEREVYVRSVRGEQGRWYRDVVARPTATLDLGTERVAVEAVAADDAVEVERVSQLMEKKYASRHRASTDAMLQPHTLPTTLRVLPA